MQMSFFFLMRDRAYCWDFKRRERMLPIEKLNLYSSPGKILVTPPTAANLYGPDPQIPGAT